MLENITEPDRDFQVAGTAIHPHALPGKIQIIGWVFVLCAALFLSLRGYDSFQIGVTQDDAEYAVLARSIVQSDRYGLINWPGEPGPTRYPFGYPLLLSPLAAFFPETPDALKLLSLAATVLNGGLLFWGWRWFSPSTSSWFGLAVAGLYLLSPRTIVQSRTVMSEPIFTTLCLMTILFVHAGKEKRPGTLACLAIGAGLLLTMFTKTAGAALVVVVWATWLFRWRKAAWRPVAAVSASMLLLLGFIILATPIEVKDILPSDYADQFASPSRWGQDQSEDSLRFRLGVGISDYLTEHIRQLILPVGGGETERAFFTRRGLPFVPALFGLVISGVITLGFFRWLSEEPFSIPVLFSLLFLLIMIVWPWRGPRYLYPVQPQLYLALLLGSAAILDQLVRSTRIKGPASRFLLGAFCLGLWILYAILSSPRDDSRLHTGDLRDRTSWLKGHTDPTAVIMTEQPQIDYLYSSRKTVPYGNFSSIDQLEDHLVKHRVTHILIAPQLEWKAVYQPGYSTSSLDLQKIIRLHTAEGRFKLVSDAENDGVSVYQVNP